MEIRLLMAVVLASLPGWASEADALAISANIQARHMPFGTVMDPVYASPTSTQITGYTRCGDSALWTGAYLAAESFRYRETQSAEALANVKAALTGIKGLVDVTGSDLLARCAFPANSPYAAGLESEESANGVYQNPPLVWIGNTSRDEYVGVVFGLGVAYDAGDASVKISVSALLTRLIKFLAVRGWTIVMPGGSVTDTFLTRPDELLAMLQVGKHVNPTDLSSYYDSQRGLLNTTLTLPVSFDIASDSSYFKFNLDYMGFYNLNRLDSGITGAIDTAAYEIVRGYTASHQNAFFNLVDRALNGPDSGRDAETRALLEQWLQRPKRDLYVDVSHTVNVCGSEACQPVPVPLRPPTDFLWQRNPFQLSGGGAGLIESAGIDYILPYWMARGSGVLSASVVQSAAAGGVAVAANSLASLYGSALTTTTAQAGTLPAPTTLGGVTLLVTDSAGTQRKAPLTYVSPQQINFVVPDGTASGPASFMVTNQSVFTIATGEVQNVAPSLFSANGSGTGVAAATALQVQAANPQLQTPVTVYQCTTSGCSSVPIALGVDTPVYLSLYGTGIRNRSALANVKATIGGVSVPVLYAGPQPDYSAVGLDQVNVALVLSLRGAGESQVVLTVDGQASNAVTVRIK